MNNRVPKPASHRFELVLCVKCKPSFFDDKTVNSAETNPKKSSLAKLTLLGKKKIKNGKL